MKRKELLESNEYWIAQMQNNLFSAIEDFMIKNKLNRTQLADKLGVSKGYISQILNGDFDHKISKLVELSLATGNVPLLNFVNLNDYIDQDNNNRFYALIPMLRAKQVAFVKGDNYQTEGAPIQVHVPIKYSSESFTIKI